MNKMNNNILKSYKDVDDGNIDLYLEELAQEDNLWYRIVNDKIEFKHSRHNRLKSIQNYNDFEKLLKESYNLNQTKTTSVSVDDGGGGPEWVRTAILYEGQFVKYNGSIVNYNS